MHGDRASSLDCGVKAWDLSVAPNPNFDAYYGLFDFEFWPEEHWR